MGHVDKNRVGNYQCFHNWGHWAVVGPSGFIMEYCGSRFAARKRIAELDGLDTTKKDDPNAPWMIIT